MSREGHYKNGEAYSVEHLGQKIAELDIQYDFVKPEGILPSWRNKQLLIQEQQKSYKVLGWLDNADQKTVTYTTIPLKLQKNCRAFLRGSPIGIEGKVTFDEKRVPSNK